MKVWVNNKEVETAAVSLASLVEELSLPAQGIAVAVENRMVPRGGKPHGAPDAVGGLCLV